mgnify:CR=1 FL=1
MKDIKWEKPSVEPIGSAEELIKNVDVDGTGDSFFPGNLASG